MNGFKSRALRFVGVGLLASLGTAAGALAGTGVPGPNVNIIGPTPNPAHIPDKTFKQQNEPACTVQPDRPQNIFCAYNDYRGVDIPGIADSWIGASLSRNNGETWTSRLIPGFPGDASTINEQFAADATATAVPGMAIVNFIAAGRDSKSRGGIYLQRWLEVNKEDGAPWEPLDTLPIVSGTSGQFVDKPAMLVTLRTAAPVATTLATGVVRNLVPGEIHVAYANFSGNDTNDSASIYYTRSTDYGRTWSNKNKLSESIALNQGVTLAANGDTILAVWRQFDKNSNQPDSFAYAISSNRGGNWSKPSAVPLPAGSVCPFSQPGALPEANYSFRTNALPVSVSDGKRFYVFWAQRTGGTCLTGPSRIAYLSTDGTSWDAAPTLVDPDGDHPAAHQIMPAAFAAGGVIEVAWYDTRNDEYWGTGPAQVLPYVTDSVGAETDAEGNSINRRHTADTYHAQLVGGVSRGAVNVSQYAEGDFDARGEGRQLERNYVNGRLFKQATKPFVGDYIAAAAPAFRLGAGGLWVSNQGTPGPTDAAPSEPTFYVAWADNRDVRSNVYRQSACLPGAAPGSPGCPGASDYTPALQGEPGSSATGVCQPDFPAATDPDDLHWTQGGPQQSLKALSRNQNIYASVIKPGVVFGTASASKPTDIQRAFVVFLQNVKASGAQTFDLRLSPVYPAGTGPDAEDRVSFAQSGATQLRELLVPVPEGSSAARTVFVTSKPGRVLQARVEAYEVSCTVAGCSETLAASIVLNGNPAADNLKNPDCKASSTCLDADVTLFEGHNPELYFDIYSVENPSYRNPSLRNPSLRNFVYENPSLRNQTVEFPSLRNPSLRNSPITDDAAAQEQTYTDFVYDVANGGNTTSAYNLKPLITGDMTDAEGNALYYPQLIVSRVYAEETAQNCDAVNIDRQQVIVNIKDPDVAPTTPTDALADPGLVADARHATFFVEPGGNLQITLRIWGVDAVTASPEFRNRVWMKVYAQALNSDGTGPEDLSYDLICGDGSTSDCPEPDVQKPVFGDDPGFPLYSPQPANVPFQIEANAPGGWLAEYRDPLVTDDSAVAVVCTPRGVVLGVGPQSVVCTATDAAGNSSSTEYDFVVTDEIAPVVSVELSPDVADGVEAASPSGATANFIATANDFVNGPGTPTCTPPSGSTFAIGDTAVTCSATDPVTPTGTDPGPPARDLFTGGKTGTVTFTITVQDTTPPPFLIGGEPVSIQNPLPSIQQEATGPSGAIVSYDLPLASESVSPPVTVSCEPPPGSTFALGDTTVTCTATDARGNPNTASFTVTVRDSTPPTVAVPADITAQATSAAGAAVAFSTSATDVVDGALGTTCTPVSGTTFVLGATTVNCSATDTAGNTGSRSFKVTVVDTTAPVVTVPANITIEATSSAGAVVTFASSANDIVDGAVTAACLPTSGSTFPLGSTTVTCTARDAKGNIGTGGFTVTVRDTTAPLLTVPAPITAEATSAAGAVVAFSASATDVVDGALGTTCTPASGTTFALGATTVTCTARDAKGNIGTGSFTVTVRDTTAPTLTVPSAITATTSGTTAVISYTVTATDNVGVKTLTCSSTSPGASGVSTTGGTFPVGTSTVGCTATDAAGKSTSKSFTVTVTKLGYAGLDGVYANGSKSVNSSVPLDFGFTGASGSRVGSSAAQPVVTVYFSGAKTCGTSTGTLIASYPGSSDYRYSASSLNWQFNWKTTGLATGCYKITVTSSQPTQTFASKNTVTLTK
jgi:hypothetical protein